MKRASRAAIRAVIEAMKDCGLQPGEVRVHPDGGFTVAVAGQAEEFNPADFVDMSEDGSKKWAGKPFGC